MKNIVLAFDGTWNTPDDEDTDRDQDDSTNVWKFYEAVSPSTPQGIEQIKWYEKGVGTNWYTKITGGVFGAGLSNRIQDGYQWLAENFAEGDQIYLVGFSRGAYTAPRLGRSARHHHGAGCGSPRWGSLSGWDAWWPAGLSNAAAGSAHCGGHRARAPARHAQPAALDIPLERFCSSLWNFGSPSSSQIWSLRTRSS